MGRWISLSNRRMRSKGQRLQRMRQEMLDHEDSEKVEEAQALMTAPLAQRECLFEGREAVTLVDHCAEEAVPQFGSHDIDMKQGVPAFGSPSVNIDETIEAANGVCEKSDVVEDSEVFTQPVNIDETIEAAKDVCEKSDVVEDSEVFMQPCTREPDLAELVLAAAREDTAGK